LTCPTARGFGAICSTILLVAFYEIKPDPILLLPSAALVAIVLSDLIASYVRWSKPCKCDAEVKERVWVWEKPNVEFKITGYGVLAAEGSPSWLKKITQYSVSNQLFFKATAFFPHSGNFSIEDFRILRTSPIKLFARKEPVRCSVEFEVLPEALYWILEALAILKATSGIRYSGAGAPKTPASTGLYYETREYLPGDPIRNVDWKASSRRRKLMVKVFQEESAGGITIYYDLRSPTPYACDELASALISSTIYSHRSGLDIRLSSIQEGKTFKPSSSYEAIAFAVRKVLEHEVLRVSEFFEYVEPMTRRELEELLSTFPTPKSHKISYTLFSENNIVISSLLYDTISLLDIVSSSKIAGGSLNIIVPSKPWRGVGDLEEAYRIHLSYDNVRLKLERLNAKVLPWKHFRQSSLESRKMFAPSLTLHKFG